jgi:hypothetical protein
MGEYGIEFDPNDDLTPTLRPTAAPSGLAAVLLRHHIVKTGKGAAAVLSIVTFLLVLIGIGALTLVVQPPHTPSADNLYRMNHEFDNASQR